MNLEETFNDLMNNVKMSMIQSGGDPNSLGFDNFKENFSNSIKKTMNTSQNSQSQFSNDNMSFSPMQNTTNTIETSKKMSSWFIFKIVLGLLIFLILAINIFTYFKKGTDAFSYYIGNFFSKGKNNVGNIFNKGKNLNKSLSADDIHSSLDLSAKKFSENEENENSTLKNIVEKGIVGNENGDDDKQGSNYFGDENDDDKKENKLIGNDEEEGGEEEEEEKETDPKKKIWKKL